MFEDAYRAAFSEFLRRVVVSGEPLPESVENQLAPARVQHVKGTVAAVRGEPSTAPDRTVAAWIESWLQYQQARVVGGQLSAARCANYRNLIKHFKNFLGPQFDVEGINAEKLNAFYLHCLSQMTARRQNAKEGWSASYAHDVFSAAKTFIRWLAERETVPLPKNIGSKQFTFGSATQAISTWSVDDYKRAVDAAPDLLKLALLLMANCGMTQKDISDLLDDEVGWAKGRITRKRSKTAGEENVPVVSYPLWPLTFKLLKQFRSGQERVLLAEDGQPYQRVNLNDAGNRVKTDRFASSFIRFRKRLDLPKSLKYLRKLGATLLGSHKDYGRFSSYFLGHSPRTLADRFYVAPSQELFDEAVMWLGQQLGQVKVEQDATKKVKSNAKATKK